MNERTQDEGTQANSTPESTRRSTQENTQRMTKAGGQVLRVLQPLFLLVAAGFIVYLLAGHWRELRTYPWRLHWGWFGLANALLLVTWIMEVWIWQILLARLGGNLPLVSALRVWFLSAIVRYVPGNVWQPLSLTYMTHRHGVRPETTMASVVLYQIITLLGTLPIATLYLLLEPEDKIRPVLGTIPRWLPMLLALAPLLIFVVNPMWLFHLLNWLLRKVRRAPLAGTLTRGGLFLALVLTVGNWLLWGGTFAALSFSLGNYTPGQVQELVLHLVAIYPVAYAIGFISFFTPSGFGVREGALILFLAPFMPTAVATVLALAMRVWTMAGELILAGLATWSGTESTAAALPHSAEPG